MAVSQIIQKNNKKQKFKKLKKVPETIFVCEMVFCGNVWSDTSEGRIKNV